MNTTYTPAVSEAVISLHSGGIGLWTAVRVLLTEAGLPADEDSVRHALAVHNALQPLTDPALQ